MLAACSSPLAPTDASSNDAPDASEAACTYVLNQARTILDADLDCAAAPQRVLCEGIQASNAISPEPFRASYSAEGRLLEYYREPRGLRPETIRLEYEDGKLTNVGERIFTYDERGRLTESRQTRRGTTRTFHYDELDRLIRIEDPSGPHGTSRFRWSPDGRLESITSETSTLTQTFEQDERGRLTRHVLADGDGVIVHDFDLIYENGNLVQMGEVRFVYSEEPLDIPETLGLNPAWFLTGAQNEVYLRTGSPTRPWRVYAGDHPGGFVTAFPEFRSAHRYFGSYEMSGDAVTATLYRGNQHQMTFRPVSECLF